MGKENVSFRVRYAVNKDIKHILIESDDRKDHQQRVELSQHRPEQGRSRSSSMPR